MCSNSTTISSNFSTIKWIPSTFFILLFAVNAHSQDAISTQQKIDSLISIADTLGRAETTAIPPLAHKLITLSQKTNSAKGKSYGYFLRALSLYYVNDYKNSISYLNKAKQEKEYLETDPLLFSAIHCLYGSDYHLLGFIPLAKRHFLKAVQWAKKKADYTKMKRQRMEEAYLNLISMYMITEKADSVRQYTDAFKNTPFHTDRKNGYMNVMYGKYHILKGNIDSASHYYSKGYTYFKNSAEPYREVALHGMAEVAYHKKNYQQALTYDKEALGVSIVEIRIVILKYIAGIYNQMGKLKKEREYLHRYRTLQDSLITAHKTRRTPVLDDALKSMLKKNTQKPQKLPYNPPLIIILSLGLTGIVIFFFYRKNQKNQQILSQKQQEAQSLEQKINTAFEEVVQLAKENDPSFLARFQEVYPDFYQNLRNLEPSLTKSELNLCAMIWLGFSTKDIARYTHIQPKSVQMKKYRLRKKMELPKGTDLYEWIKNL